MGRSVWLLPERRRKGPQPPATCIVNDAHLRAGGVCGRGAAEGRECSTPVCADHLCQYRLSNGRRCKRTPLRLARGIIYPAPRLVSRRRRVRQLPPPREIQLPVVHQWDRAVPRHEDTGARELRCTCGYAMPVEYGKRLSLSARGMQGVEVLQQPLLVRKPHSLHLSPRKLMRFAAFQQGSERTRRPLLPRTQMHSELQLQGPSVCLEER